MVEKPFKDREEAKKQLIKCGNGCNIYEALFIILVLIGII
jgi:hypothetical protein